MKSHVLNSIHHNSKIPYICNKDGLITLHIHKDLQIPPHRYRCEFEFYPWNNQFSFYILVVHTQFDTNYEALIYIRYSHNDYQSH